MFKYIITYKEFPYLLTILFAMMGWSLNRIVKSVSNAPMIEYKVDEEYKNNMYVYTYSIHNISQNISFYNLIFELDFEESNNDSVVGATIITHPPASIRVIDRDYGFDYANFMIKEFQPDWKYDLKVGLNHPVNLMFSFSSRDKSILLRKASLTTFLIRNELKVLVAMILLWITLILIYMKQLYTYKNESTG